MRETNWSGNYEYRARTIATPASIDEVRASISAATPESPVRALGTRHTFNALADPGESGTLVSVAGLPRRIEIDADASTVTVSAALRYGDVAIELQRHGWALHNLASLPHISIAGAVATATHGSGVGNGNLASAVSAVRFVDGTGELVELRRGQAGFDGAVVALGTLGIAVELELDIVPTYELEQRVFVDLPYRALIDDWDSILSSAYSVSVFTTWAPDSVNQVWAKSRVGTAGELEVLHRVATPATRKMHPIVSVDPIACTEQFGVPGPWHERLPHFRLDFTPSAGDEIQSEFLFPRRHTAAAASALLELGPTIAPLLFTSEIRQIAADRLWLSTAYSGGDDEFADGATAFHFTWVRDQAAVEAVLPAIEAVLAPFGARPHWGKVFTTRVAALGALYPRLDDMRMLHAQHDPEGLFLNPATAPLFS